MDETKQLHCQEALLEAVAKINNCNSYNYSRNNSPINSPNSLSSPKSSTKNSARNSPQNSHNYSNRVGNSIDIFAANLLDVDITKDNIDNRKSYNDSDSDSVGGNSHVDYHETVVKDYSHYNYEDNQNVVDSSIQKDNEFNNNNQNSNSNRLKRIGSAYLPNFSEIVSTLRAKEAAAALAKSRNLVRSESKNASRTNSENNKQLNSPGNCLHNSVTNSVTHSVIYSVANSAINSVANSAGNSVANSAINSVANSAGNSVAGSASTSRVVSRNSSGIITLDSKLPNSKDNIESYCDNSANNSILDVGVLTVPSITTVTVDDNSVANKLSDTKLVNSSQFDDVEDSLCKSYSIDGNVVPFSNTEKVENTTGNYYDNSHCNSVVVGSKSVEKVRDNDEKTVIIDTKINKAVNNEHTNQNKDLKMGVSRSITIDMGKTSTTGTAGETKNQKKPEIECDFEVFRVYKSSDSPYNSSSRNFQFTANPMNNKRPDSLKSSSSKSSQSSTNSDPTWNRIRNNSYFMLQNNSNTNKNNSSDSVDTPYKTISAKNLSIDTSSREKLNRNNSSFTSIQSYSNETKRPIELLTDSEVQQLLISLKLSKYVQCFIENEVDGLTLSMCETQDDLKELGIDVRVKAKFLFQRINDFKRIGGVPLSFLAPNSPASSTGMLRSRSDISCNNISGSFTGSPINAAEFNNETSDSINSLHTFNTMNWQQTETDKPLKKLDSESNDAENSSKKLTPESFSTITNFGIQSESQSDKHSHGLYTLNEYGSVSTRSNNRDTDSQQSDHNTDDRFTLDRRPSVSSNSSFNTNAKDDSHAYAAAMQVNRLLDQRMIHHSSSVDTCNSANNEKKSDQTDDSLPSVALDIALEANTDKDYNRLYQLSALGFRRAADKILHGSADNKFAYAFSIPLLFFGLGGIDKSPSEAAEAAHNLLPWLRHEASNTTKNMYAQWLLALCYQYGIDVAADMEAALHWYKLSANAGYSVAQYTYGCLLQKGLVSGEKDLKEAVAMFQKAANQGYYAAQYSLGVCYDRSEGVNRDRRAAVRLYRLAAAQGYAIAQFSLGDCYYHGEGVIKDPVVAMKWYSLAAQQGYAAAQNSLGICYEKGIGSTNKEGDYNTAVIWYKKAASQGSKDAKYNLGNCFKDGKGVEQVDINEALLWYQMAAEAGQSSAQNMLGVCLACGHGVSIDHKKAFQLFRKAAHTSNPFAEYNLGFCLEFGLGTEANMKTALQWYKKSATAGLFNGQVRLAQWYGQIFRDGYMLDFEKAMKWYKSAGVKHGSKMHLNLAKSYEKGEGVAKSVLKAYEYYKRACEAVPFTSSEILR